MRRTAAAPKLLEKDIVGQVRTYMRCRGWRPHKTGSVSGPGYSFGEPGEADFQFIRYLENGVCLLLWVEFKGPNDRRGCTCRPGESKICKVCRQKAWQKRERERGAIVWEVDDFLWFESEYMSYYGWLHRGDAATGQLDLLQEA